MAVIDLVKWNSPKGVYAVKYPSEELATWTQLIVSETQEAVLLKEGRMLGPFGPGKHTLDTKNIPVLSKFFKIPFGKKSPFTAEVWFVNKTSQLDIKWGTANPIQIKDPVYNVMIPLRVFGQFGIAIDHTKKFIKTLVGTLPSFTEPDLQSYFKGIVLSKVKDHLAKQLVNEGVSLLEISSHLVNLSSHLEKSFSEEFAEFGIKIKKFRIISIDADPNDPAVSKLKEALAEKARLDIMGMSYQQERSFDVMQDAAGNEGTAGGAMGAGIGMGMGMGMGVPMGSSMGGIAGNLDASGTSDKNAKKISCDKCSNPINIGAKFCPACGDTVDPCPNCGEDNALNATNCRSCNTKLATISECRHCGGKISADISFCNHCGKSNKIICSSCDNVLETNTKFCNNCGTPVSNEKKE
jgi:membrane protease subunit (stomatin/prohibitin family)